MCKCRRERFRRNLMKSPQTFWRKPALMTSLKTKVGWVYSSDSLLRVSLLPIIPTSLYDIWWMKYYKLFNDCRIRRFYLGKSSNNSQIHFFLGHSDRNSFWWISNPIFTTYLTDKASIGDSKIILKSSSVKISIVKKPVSHSNSKQTVEVNKQDSQSTDAATSSGLLSLCQQYDSDDDDWFSDPFNLYLSRYIRQIY